MNTLKKKNSTKINFIRYCDDFIVTANSEETAREIKDKIAVFLKERGLELSDDKTLITNIMKASTFWAGIFASTKASY